MFRKMLTSHVATVALAAGFATALAAPAGAVVCNNVDDNSIVDVSTFDFDSGYASCTIDFLNLDGEGAPNSGITQEYWGAYGSTSQRGIAAANPPFGQGRFEYNVFGTTERVGAGATSGSADLIVLAPANGQVPIGGFTGVGIGVGPTNAQGVAALINNDKRLEFMFRDPTGGRNDEAGGYDRADEVILRNIQIVSYRAGQSFTIEAFNAAGEQNGFVELVTRVTGDGPGLAANSPTVATAANAEVATYEVGLTGVRFQIVGTQLAATGGPSGGAAGNGLYGVSVRGATFVSGIPLPGALIPALTGLAALGGLAARRRRQKAA